MFASLLGGGGGGAGIEAKSSAETTFATNYTRGAAGAQDWLVPVAVLAVLALVAMFALKGGKP